MTTSLVCRQMDEMGASKHDCISAARTGRIGRTTVGRLLRKLGFGLVANRKSLTGQCIPTATASLTHSSCATAVPASRLSCQVSIRT